MRGHSKHGFLLTEQLIVLAMCTILAGFTGYSLRWLYRIVVRAEAEKLYATCLFVQHQAMTTGLPRDICFEHSNKTYYYQNCREKLGWCADFGVIDGVKGPPSAPSSYIKNPITFPRNTITCYPQGIIQAGSIYLTDINKQFLYAVTCGVGIIPHMRLYAYEGCWVKEQW